MILPERTPQVVRRSLGKRVRRQELAHDGVAFEQAQEEGVQPKLALAASECRKPHLPIKAWHVRGGEARPAIHGSGLPAELIGQPRQAVGTALDQDLGTFFGHDGEKPIAVEGAKRRQGREEVLRRVRDKGACTQTPECLAARDREEKCREEDRRKTGKLRARDEAWGRSGRWKPPVQARGNKGAQHPVIEERNTQGQREKVEEAIVSGESDRQLRQNDRAAGNEAYPTRAEDSKRCHKLNGKGGSTGEVVHERREVVHVRAGPGREGLRPVVVGECAEIAPRLVAGKELHHPGKEDESEEKPAKEEERDASRRTCRRREAHGEKARLKEQRVPLVA